MKPFRHYAAALLLVSLAVSCVPARKLEEEKSKREACEKELASLKSEKQQLEIQVTEMRAKITDMEKQIFGLQKDTAITGTNYRNLTQKYDKLNQVNEQLLAQIEKLMKGSQDESSKLMGQLSVTQDALLKKQDELKKLQLELEAKQKELDDREAKIKEMQDILRKKDQAITDLKKKVSDALVGFEGNGLTVTQKNGKIYVSMEENLLFASGSTTVQAKGIEALKKLAKVLEQNKDINIMVEGHTDDVPMKGAGDIKDNWDLSVMRATSVTKILLNNGDIAPKRISAAGRGEFFPIDAGKTSDARKKNRRTEIILTPKLDELLKVLESN
jgi:chemotaxis protein MotB